MLYFDPTHLLRTSSTALEGSNGDIHFAAVLMWCWKIVYVIRWVQFLLKSRSQFLVLYLYEPQNIRKMYSSRRHSSHGASTFADMSRDKPLSSPPDDSISDLSWSSSADLLAVGAWDNKLRIYSISSNLRGVVKAVVEFKGPVLSCDWSRVRLQYINLARF